MPFKSEFKVGKPLNLPKFSKKDAGSYVITKTLNGQIPFAFNQWEKPFKEIHEPLKSYTSAHIFLSMEAYDAGDMAFDSHLNPRVQGVYIKEHTILYNKVPKKTLEHDGFFYPFGFMDKSDHPLVGKLRDELIAMVRTTDDCIIYEGEVEGVPTPLGFLKEDQLKKCRAVTMEPNVVHYLTPKSVIRYTALKFAGPMAFLTIRVPYKTLSDA